MLPDAQHAPAGLAQFTSNLPVARAVANKLGVPKPAVLARAVSWVAVPEAAVLRAAVDKHAQALAAKHEVRVAS